MRTEKANKAKQIANPWSKKTIKIVAVVIVIIVTFLLVDIFTPIWGGQVKYYAKWIECGQQPQQIKAKLGGHIEYHELSYVFDPFRDNRIKYFCTPKEAELAGYSSNPDSYDYPNLTPEERRQRAN